MRNRTTIMLAVAGALALAATGGASGQEQDQVQEQARQRTEGQLGNAGEAAQVRSQKEIELAVRQRAGQPEVPGQVGQAAQQRARIYGEEFMTVQERFEYQERLQAMNTEQERQRFEKEHRKLMQERARQQGKALDEDGNVLAGDQLRDRDRDRDQDMDRDRDRDRIHQTEPMSRPMPAPAPAPGRGGGGRGGG